MPDFSTPYPRQRGITEQRELWLLLIPPYPASRGYECPPLAGGRGIPPLKGVRGMLQQQHCIFHSPLL
ncbi:MAG: hypothetical protein CVU88_07325, partial [Firmicutes bacterium HGW-Firmicutes-13]